VSRQRGIDWRMIWLSVGIVAGTVFLALMYMYAKRGHLPSWPWS
jgi:hypothetical protein